MPFSPDDTASIKTAVDLLDRARIILMGVEEDSAELLDAVCVIEETLSSIEGLVN